jgi:hypothetical protein
MATKHRGWTSCLVSSKFLLTYLEQRNIMENKGMKKTKQAKGIGAE